MANINSPYFIGQKAHINRAIGAQTLPVISMGLDSVRTYQFEIHFDMPGGSDPQFNKDKLTLAAKQVSQIGMSIEPIEVHRVNDKVFYPGKASPENLVVTFDNFYDPKVANTLWQWFSYIYDPTNGKYLTSMGNDVNWKAPRATIVHLDGQGQPLNETRVFGVWPIAWKTAEFNYGTNEFHTIEMTMRYDFMEHVVAGTEAVGSALTSV